jgi:hypothetical protein
MTLYQEKIKTSRTTTWQYGRYVTSMACNLEDVKMTRGQLSRKRALPNLHPSLKMLPTKLKKIIMPSYSHTRRKVQEWKTH